RGQQPVVVGAPMVKQYPVPGGNAEALAKMLQEIYQGSTTIRISAPQGGNSIIVLAGPDDQFEIAKHIVGANEKPIGTTEVLPLQSLEAGKTVETLQKMLGEPKSGGPYLEADTNKNAIIVKGSRDQMEDVKSALRALGESQDTG